ncbi:MAG: APC family permease [Bacteroidota bacterium]
MAAIAEEVKNPGKNLPRAIMLALSLISIIYGLVVFVLVGNIPLEELAKDKRPIYTLFNLLGGKWAGIIAAVLGVVTLSSMANSGVLAASRFPFAMSRDNLLPPIFHKVGVRFKTPYICILLTGALMACMILFIPIERIVKLASAFKIMMFMGVNACVIILRETGVEWYKPNYRSPFYPWIQIFGIVSGIILIGFLGGLALVGAVVITVSGIIAYQFYGKKHANRKGVWQRYGKRAYLNPKEKPTLLPNYRSEEWKAMALKEGARFQTPAPVSEDAAIVVPLFGNERSPETLAEIAGALADSKKVQVVHLTEAPEQTMLRAMAEDNPVVKSLNRRMSAMAEEKNINIEFASSVTHEILETVQVISERTHCEWMVMGISGRASHGSWIRNPVRWLMTHLDCNMALFRDAGVRYIRQILVYPERGSHLDLVIQTADDMARIFSAEITFIRVAAPEADETELAAEEGYLKELGKSCKSTTHYIVLQDKRPLAKIIEKSAAFDLLITGMPKEEKFINSLLGTWKDALFEKAACSVLELSTPRTNAWDAILPNVLKEKEGS